MGRCDAARRPLNTNLTDKEFAEIYGLPAKLLFEPHKFREPAAMNWWDGVY